MNIAQELSIVRDNIAEYGMTNITQLEYDAIYQQGRAEALNIDMEKPMHFTDEQKAWVKNYIIINAKRQRADAIDSVMELFERQNVYDFNCEDCPIYGNSDCYCEEGAYEWFKREVEKLKEQK